MPTSKNNPMALSFLNPPAEMWGKMHGTFYARFLMSARNDDNIKQLTCTVTVNSNRWQWLEPPVKQKTDDKSLHNSRNTS